MWTQRTDLSIRLCKDIENSTDMRIKKGAGSIFMEDLYAIPLREVIDHFHLEEIYLPEDADTRQVVSREVNRPGLPLSGFFTHFDDKRIEIIGNAEHQYLASMEEDVREERIHAFLEHKPVAVIFSTGNEVFEDFVVLGEALGVPILRTQEKSSSFMAALISYLCVKLAPRITRHGVLVEVYGEGILILGDSGVGKSETAIELVKRGHRLIADDAVDIRKVSATTLVGSSPELIRHYVELRGIGIVDVRRIFGMGAVKETEKIDLIINLEPWVQGKMYDRLGLDQETTDIMGIQIPTTTIPVKPGRNLAIILEIAAMNNRQKKMGYNTAEEFNKRLMSQMGVEE